MSTPTVCAETGGTIIRLRKRAVPQLDAGQVNPIVEANHMQDQTKHALSAYVRSQAKWRQGRASEYPDDQRNGSSARALFLLADYVEELEARDEIRVSYIRDSIPSTGGAPGYEETQRAISRWGFGHQVTDESELSEFVSELCALVAQDTYGWLRGDDGDEFAVLSGAAEYGLRAEDVAAASNGEHQTKAHFAKTYGSAAALRVLAADSAPDPGPEPLTDDELLDFDYGRLADFSVTDAVRRLGEDEAYRTQLVAARWIDGWRERHIELAGGDRPLGESEERLAGIDWALREVVAHLRQGDLAPGGVLYEEEITNRLLA